MLQKSFYLNKKTEEIGGGSQENYAHLHQNIRNGKKCCSISFNTRCYDYLLRYVTLVVIGNRVIQKLPRLVSMVGIGNFHVKSDHDIQQFKLPLNNGINIAFSGMCMDEITTTFSKNLMQRLEEKHIEQIINICQIFQNLSVVQGIS